MFTHSDEFVERHVFIFNWKLKIIFNVRRQHLDMTLTENLFSKTARVKIIPFGTRVCKSCLPFRRFLLTTCFLLTNAMHCYPFPICN